MSHSSSKRFAMRYAYRYRMPNLKQQSGHWNVLVFSAVKKYQSKTAQSATRVRAIKVPSCMLMAIQERWNQSLHVSHSNIS